MGSSRVGSNPTRSVILWLWENSTFNENHISLFATTLAAMAEWLRRLTRNQMGSSRVGSNPTRSVDRFYIRLWNVKWRHSTKLTTMGIEPTIFRFEVGRLIHWATRPMLHSKYFSFKYNSTIIVKDVLVPTFLCNIFSTIFHRCYILHNVHWLRLFVFNFYSNF